MATSLDKLENKVEIHHPHVNRFHTVKRLRKLVEHIRRYSTKYASFLAMSYLMFTNESCQLWSYWTEFHDIFTQHTGIICAVNAHIDVLISRSISECHSNKGGSLPFRSSRSWDTCLDIYYQTTINYVNVQHKFHLLSCFLPKLLDRSSPKFYTI